MGVRVHGASILSEKRVVVAFMTRAGVRLERVYIVVRVYGCMGVWVSGCTYVWVVRGDGLVHSGDGCAHGHDGLVVVVVLMVVVVVTVVVVVAVCVCVCVCGG